MELAEKKVFTPNSVLIPEEYENDKEVDPKDCTLLFIDGNRDFAQVFIKEEWENDQKPSFVLHDDAYYRYNELEEVFFCHSNLNINAESRKKRIQLLPEMFVLKIDETIYWDKETCEKFKIKRIFGVYVLNLRNAVHLCEITPSHELLFMNSQWEADLPDDYDYDQRDKIVEEIHDFISEGDQSNETHSYIHCSEVREMLKVEVRRGILPPLGKKAGGYALENLDSVTEEDAIEEIRELVCNGEL